MKWDKPTGSIQQTKDGRYLIIQANSQHCVAYDLNSYDAPKELGVKSTDAEARTLCDLHETRLQAEHRRGA